MPTLRPGDIVLMDNLGSHKGLAGRHAIPRGRRQALLPAEMLADLNPIEQVCAKLLLSDAAARRFDTITTALGQFLDTFTPYECANYFTASGYAARCQNHPALDKRELGMLDDEGSYAPG